MFDGRVFVLRAAAALDEAALLRGRLADWPVPTLAVHGTADICTDPAVSRQFVGGIASADKARPLVDARS